MRFLGSVSGPFPQHTLWPWSLISKCCLSHSLQVLPDLAAWERHPIRVEGVWAGSPFPGGKPGSLMASACPGTHPGQALTPLCPHNSKLPLGLVVKLLKQCRILWTECAGLPSLWPTIAAALCPCVCLYLPNGFLCMHTCTFT